MKEYYEDFEDLLMNWNTEIEYARREASKHFERYLETHEQSDLAAFQTFALVSKFCSDMLNRTLARQMMMLNTIKITFKERTES